MRSFVDQYKPRKAIIVCNERAQRLVGDIMILPGKIFAGNCGAERSCHEYKGDVKGPRAGPIGLKIKFL